MGGGIAAVAAEITAGTLPSSMDPDTILNISRMVSAFAAFAAKGDVNSGALAATNAVENNYLNPAYSFEQEQERLKMSEYILNDNPCLLELREAMHRGLDSMYSYYESLPFMDYLSSYQIDGVPIHRIPSHFVVDSLMPTSGAGMMSAGLLFARGPGTLARGASVDGGMYMNVTREAGRRIAALNLERWKFTPQIFDKTVTWTAPKGTQQTYKVFQRNDIDWSMMRTEGPKSFIGKTNVEAAKNGFAPQLNDGNFATLHHIGQNAKGALAEASTRLHSFKNSKAFKSLHNQFGGGKHPEFPVGHGRDWRADTSEYWKMRGNIYEK